MFGCTNSQIVRKKKKKVDILGNLSPETVHNICLYLTPTDISEFWNCSPRWRYQLLNESFWKRKCEVDGIFPVEESNKTEVFKKLTDRCKFWHSTYLYGHALNYNWNNNIYEEVIVKHPLDRINIIYFDNEILIIAGPPSCKIHIYNSSTGIIQRTFSTKEKYIWEYVIKKHNNLLIYQTYFNVFVWNIYTGELLMTKTFTRQYNVCRYSVHKNLIIFVCVTANYGDLYILNMDTLHLELVTRPIVIFGFFNNLGAFLRDDGTLNIYNIDNKKLMKFKGCPLKHSILKILLKDHYLIIFCDNWHISTWNIETLTQLISFSTFDHIPHVNGKVDIFIKFMLLDGSRIGYKITNYAKFYVWDFLTGTFLFDIHAPESYHQVMLGNHILFTFFNPSHRMDIRCPKTGKLIRRTNVIHKLSRGTLDACITETKMVVLTGNDLVIRDYDKKITIDI